MHTQPDREYEESLGGEIPEDVAVLYSWANLHGARYRDFSASRREYRAQVRHRAAEELRQAELQAQAEAERAAAEAEQAALEAEQVARTASGSVPDDRTRELALLAAGEAARIAATERAEASRRAEAAAIADATARREEREIAEAHASARRQAERYTDSDFRRRVLAGPQPSPTLLPGLVTDPYVHSQGSGPAVDLYSPNTQLELVQPHRFAHSRPPEPVSSGTAGHRLAGGGAEEREGKTGFQPDEVSGVHGTYRPEPSRMHLMENHRRNVGWAPTSGIGSSPEAFSGEPRRASLANEGPEGAPAWLFERQFGAAVPKAETASTAALDDPFQSSRERVASRWYGLKGTAGESGDGPVIPRPQPQTPLLAVYSRAGGVGKTSLVATLGRAFSAMGEKVLLADTTSQGLLPYYFGASELKPGIVRTFSPPEGSSDAAIHLVSYDIDPSADRVSREVFGNELLRVSAPARRTLVDVQASSSWLFRSLQSRALTILVPLAPDMNSVISLPAVERALSGLADEEGRPILAFYVLNQFDASIPLHADIREVLRRQLGDRLLPHTIRRASAVCESLAEGMTVIDYAPGSPIEEDYTNLAQWVLSVTPPEAAVSPRASRWSER